MSALPCGAFRTFEFWNQEEASLRERTIHRVKDMEPLFIVFAVLLSIIAVLIILALGWLWRDGQRRLNANRRRLDADQMIALMARKKRDSKRVVLPKEMAYIHERWAEKKEQGVPPSRGSMGQLIRRKIYSPPRRSGIREDPIREALIVPEAVADSTPHPRGGPVITPDMVRRRSPGLVHDVEVDIMGQPAHFSGEPRRQAALPPITEEVLIPEPVTRAIARRDSVTEASLPDRSQNRWGARSGSTEPSTGQLPETSVSRRSSSRTRSPSPGSSGSAGSGAQVVVDPNTGAATWHAPPKR